ncbi:gamma-aminobutyric acid type B receptor subunit 2-like [Pholidichthys leucotaenia]
MGQCVFRLLLVLPLLVLVQGVRQPLPVLWMMPLSSDSGSAYVSGSGSENRTVGLLSAVRLALEDLKNQPGPVGDYEVQIQLLDSQCDPAKALNVLLDAMWVDPKFLLLIGGLCPTVTAFLARSLPGLGLVQVSFAASSPALSYRKWYGNVFSTLPSDRVLNQATVKLLQRYRWTRVGVVMQEGVRLSEMKKDLEKQLLKVDIQVVSTEVLSEDVCSSLRRLKDEDIWIIIALFDDDSASEVFCCAYSLNLFGPRFQWIVAGGGTAGGRLRWRHSACSTKSLLMAVDGSFRLQIREFSSSNAPGVSGRTPQDYQDSYHRQLVQDRSEDSPLHPFAYDAVWLAVRALVQTTEAVKRREKFGALRNITVSREETEKMLLDAVRRTKFEGVTGPVFFRNGERMTTVELIQFQASADVLVGEFNMTSQQLRLRSQLLKFKGPGPARDQTMVLVQHAHTGILIFIIMSSFSAAIIIIILIALVVVLTNCKHWTIVSADASQDKFLLLGLLLSSSSVLVSGLDQTLLMNQRLDVLCSAAVASLSVGHSLSLIILISKSWTLYRLHISHQKSSRPPLCSLLLLLLFLETLVLTCWFLLDPLRWTQIHHPDQVNPPDYDIIIRSFSERCSSVAMETWLTTIFGYKTPLMLFGCFLAWSVRMVNGGKCLVFTVALVTVSSVSGVLGWLLISHDPPLQFCVSSIIILSCDVITLALMFGPKMMLMWSSSSDQPHQSVMKLQGDDDDDDDDEDDDGDQLTKLNQQLKSRVALLDIEIETITMEMYEDPISHVTHEAQICADGRRNDDDINSPEHVQRRLSLQLPILHHSYLPTIGGASSSSSSLFHSQDSFAHHHFLYV